MSNYLLQRKHAARARAQASVDGLRFFNTDRPCKYGHSSDRYVADGKCVECSNIRNATYVPKWFDKNKERVAAYWANRYAANKERFKEKSRQWRKDNRARMNEQGREWRAANLERSRETNRKWVKNNPEKVKARTDKRRARKMGAEGFYTDADIKMIYNLQGGKCIYCNDELREDFQVDHIVPLIKRGTNWPKNIQLLCSKQGNACNQRKGGRDPVEFARSLGQLV